MKASKRLRDMFSEINLETYELDLHHKQESIILKDLDIDEYGEPIKRKGKAQSKEIEYEDTPQIVTMRENLTAYNQLLAETYIDVVS